MTATAAAFAVSATTYLWVASTKVAGPMRLVKVVPALIVAVALRAEPILVAVFVLYAAGDFFLLDKARAFLAGLGSFLVGHIVLIAWIARSAHRAPSLAGVALGTVAGIAMVTLLWPALSRTLRGAVPVYALALVGLVAAGSAWNDTALLGAVVFLASDAVLGWQKFRTPFPGGDTVVLSTYYGALALLGLALAQGPAPS